MLSRGASFDFGQDQEQFTSPGLKKPWKAAVADALRSRDFRPQPWEFFPPVGPPCLPARPTVLINLAHANRIERAPRTDCWNLASHPKTRGLYRVPGWRRKSDLSALVVDTGGIAFFPSISQSHHGVDIALEKPSPHEMGPHHWLWFSPIGVAATSRGGETRTLERKP